MKVAISIWALGEMGWKWAHLGYGKLTGNRIVDCDAELGDEVYGALEGAIEYGVQGSAEPGTYIRTVNGTDWQVEVQS